jgi:hypothetical protein
MDPFDGYEVWIKVEYHGKLGEEYPLPNLNEITIGEALLWYVKERRKWLKRPDTLEKQVRLWQLTQWRKDLLKKIEQEQEKWK